MPLTISQFADRLNEIIPVLMRGIFKQQKNELGKGKITVPQFVILDFLSRQQEARMTDMARFIGVTTAAMTGLVDRLVNYKYVERIFDPEDRRIIKIRLTTEGNRLVTKINRQRRETIVKIFSGVSGHDRAEYLRILTKIHENIN
jgi:DNA-binding MarR family transcriptional regulator